MPNDFFDDLSDFSSPANPALDIDPTGGVAQSLAKLASLIEDLNRDRSPDAILDRAMSAAIELTGAERGFLVLIEPNGEWKYSVARNMSTNIADAEAASSQTFVRKVLEERRSILINDVLGGSDLSRHDSIAKMRVRSVMGSPLISKGKLLGAAYVDTAKLAGVFDQTSLILFETFVHLAAVALENARLYDAEAESKARYKALQEYLAAILQSQPHGVLILDSDGVVDYANPQAVLVLGGQLRIGSTLENSSCAGEAYETLREAMMLYKQTGENSRRTLHLRNRVAAYSFFNLKGGHDGRERIGLTLEDISVQKKLEQQLIESEKRSTVNQLAGGIAHEINNSLQPVKGRVELLAMRMEKAGIQINESIGKDLSTIAALTERIEKIAKNLRHLTKPSQPALESVNIKSLLDSTVELLETTTGSLRGFSRDNDEDAPFALDLDLEDDLVIYGDPHGLESAFINLIINSVHALEESEGGKLSISAHRAVDRIEITIADTGCGIPADQINRIFEPYFTTKGEQGTGLGMSIVRNIAEIHGADLKLDSQVGRGTTVTLSFPAYTEVHAHI
ncbi:GAF domain-containing protein [bacterium]|nr:GAF domain-containing protein [bacterium]